MPYKPFASFLNSYQDNTDALESNKPNENEKIVKDNTTPSVVKEYEVDDEKFSAYLDIERASTSDYTPTFSKEIFSEIIMESLEKPSISRDYIIASIEEGSSKQSNPSTIVDVEISKSEEKRLESDTIPGSSIEYEKNTIFCDSSMISCKEKLNCKVKKKNIELRNKHGKWVKRKVMTKRRPEINYSSLWPLFCDDQYFTPKPSILKTVAGKDISEKQNEPILCTDSNESTLDFRTENKSPFTPKRFQYICQQLKPIELLFSNKKKIIRSEIELKVKPEEMLKESKIQMDITKTDKMSGEKEPKHVTMYPESRRHLKYVTTSQSSFQTLDETCGNDRTLQKIKSILLKEYSKPDEMSIPSDVAGLSTQGNESNNEILKNVCKTDDSENFRKLLPEMIKSESSMFLKQYFACLDETFKLGGEMFLYNQRTENSTLRDKDQEEESEDNIEENYKRGPSASVTFKKQVIINKEDRDPRSKSGELDQLKLRNRNKSQGEDEGSNDGTDKDQQKTNANKEQPVRLESFQRKSALRDSHTSSSSVLSSKRSVTIRHQAFPDDEFTKFAPPAYTFEEAFDLAGYGCFNIYAQIASCFIYIYAHLQMGAYIYVTALAQCEFRIKPVQRLTLENAIHIGVFTFGLIWGILSDYYGRRCFIIICTLVSVITTIMSTFCDTYGIFLAMRILTGMFMSGSMSNVLVYIAEVHTQSKRDIALARVIAGAAFIKVMACVLAWTLLPRTISIPGIAGVGVKSIAAWRVYMWVWVFFGGIGAIMFVFLPETPIFLHAEIGAFKALPVLALIYYQNSPRNCKIFPVKVLKTKSINVRKCDHYLIDTIINALQIVNVYPARRSIMILIFCKFMVSMLYFTIFKWIPGIYTAIYDNSEAYSNVCAVLNNVTSKASPWIKGQEVTNLYRSNCTSKDLSTSMFGFLLITESLLTIPFISLTCYINHYRKELLFVIMMTPGAIATLLSVLMPQALSAGMLVTFSMISGCCVLMLSGLVVDTFPADIRASAMGIIQTSGALGAIFGALLLAWSESSQCNFLFILISSAAFGSIIAMQHLWPDVNIVRKEMHNRGLSNY